MKHDKSAFDVLGKIEYERNKRNWTEYTLAKNAGLTQSTISTWYRKNLEPSLASIEKICNAFGITLSEFFNDSSMNRAIISAEKQEFYDMYDKLSPEQRSCFLALFNSFMADGS